MGNDKFVAASREKSHKDVCTLWCVRWLDTTEYAMMGTGHCSRMYISNLTSDRSQFEVLFFNAFRA